MDSESAKKLEAAARRSIGGDVLHPDRCEKITLHGVGFAVQPLIPSKGVQLIPKLAAGGAEVSVGVSQDKSDDALIAMAEKIAGEAPIREEVTCPKCGRPLSGSLEIDLDDHQAFLGRFVDYAARLLRQQYTLEDSQIESLLAFGCDDMPLWIVQAVRHAHTLPIIPPPDMGTDLDLLDELLIEAETGPGLEPATENMDRRRPWWKFWR